MAKENSTSPGQVMQNVYDEPNKALRTTATAVISGNLNIEVDAADGDNIAISDGTNTLAINPDGSINVNVANNLSIEVDASDGDNIAISDGINTLTVNPDGSIDVNVAGVATEAKQDSQITILSNIEADTNSAVSSLASIDTKLTNLDIRDLNAAQDRILTAGTINGQASGTIFYTVNNIKQQILMAHDRDQAISYADFGSKNQRITQVDYSSTTFPGFIARKTLLYVLDGGKYKRTNVVWSIV